MSKSVKNTGEILKFALCAAVTIFGFYLLFVSESYMVKANSIKVTYCLENEIPMESIVDQSKDSQYVPASIFCGTELTAVAVNEDCGNITIAAEEQKVGDYRVTKFEYIGKADNTCYFRPYVRESLSNFEHIRGNLYYFTESKFVFTSNMNSSGRLYLYSPAGNMYKYNEETQEIEEFISQK